MEKATGDIDRLVNRVDSQVEPLSADVRRTLEEANKTWLPPGNPCPGGKDTGIQGGGPRAGRHQPAGDLSSARSSLDESRKALVEVQGLTSQSAYLGYEVARPWKR